jgi:hypothetical protein
MSPEALRAAKPAAPPELRERVRLIAAAAEEPSRPRRVPWRRMSLVAVPACLAAAAVAGVVIGLSGARHEQPVTVSGTAGVDRTVTPQARNALPTLKGAALPPSTTRLQDYTATLQLEVRDANALSDRTKRAIGIARRLGGTVARVDVSTSGRSGSALVVLRIPTARVTTAIDELSSLGRIVGQHVAVLDVQRRIDTLRERVRQATGEERTRIQKQLFAELRRARLSTVAVELQTPAPVAVKPHHETRVHRILRAEGRIGLYLGLAGGPVLALLLVVWLAWRGGRRLAERRLLGA